MKTIAILLLIFALIGFIWVIIIVWPGIDHDKARLDVSNAWTRLGERLASGWQRLKNVFSGPHDT